MTREIILGYSEEELKNIPDNTVDVIFTSPPYAERRKNVYGGVNEYEYTDWFRPIAVEIKRVLKPTGSFFLNIKPHIRDGERSLYVFDLVLMLKREIGFFFVDEYSWIKQAFPIGNHGRFKNGFEPVYHFTKSSPNYITFNPLACGTKVSDETLKRANRKNCKKSTNGAVMAVKRTNMSDLELARPSNVVHAYNITNQSSRKMKHSAVFPEELVRFFVKSFSNEGDLILDMFAGSGTVGVVCDELNRNFIMIDKEEDNIHLMEHLINKKDYIPIFVRNKHSLPENLPNQIYIGRGSIFGNPYSHKEGTKAEFVVSSRTEAIENYKIYFDNKYQSDSTFANEVDELISLYNSGKDINLVCYCKPKACHGDYIKEFIISHSGKLSLF